MKKPTRPRVCAAIFRNEHILMVRHVHHGKNYWTLPGGAVESCESLHEAVIREVFEETNLRVKIGRYLFKEEYSLGTNYCFEAIAEDEEEIQLGSDPEEVAKPVDERILQEVAWRSLEEVKDDWMVVKALNVLTQFSRTEKL